MSALKAVKTETSCDYGRGFSLSVQSYLAEVSILDKRVCEWGREAEALTQLGAQGDLAAGMRALVLRRKIGAETVRLSRMRAEVLEILSHVEDLDGRLILQKRYLGYEKWEKIAFDLHCGELYVYRLHKRAINALEAFFSLRGYPRYT